MATPTPTASTETEADRIARMEAMEAEVQAFRAEQAAQREKAAKEAVAPARAFADRADVATVLVEAEKARIACAAFSQLASMLDNLATTIKLLPSVIERAEAEAEAIARQSAASS